MPDQDEIDVGLLDRLHPILEPYHAERSQAVTNKVVMTLITLAATILVGSGGTSDGLFRLARKGWNLAKQAARNVLAPPKTCAAVSFILRDNKVLCVWNKRYGGWTLPGGKVEPGETPAQAQHRELREETGLRDEAQVVTYEGPVKPQPDAPEGRGTYVYVFRVIDTYGTPQEMEPGCPVTWLTKEEFLKWTPFREFYEVCFAKIWT